MWWLRSPNCDSSNYFCTVNKDGNSDYNYASNYKGVAFGFCMIMPDKVIPNLREEISACAKGVYDLSVRINLYIDVVYRTLLALPVIVVAGLMVGTTKQLFPQFLLLYKVF